MSIYFVDFETTGLNPYHSSIIEYCFMDYNKSIDSLINPGFKFQAKIEEITGITNKMVEESPRIENKKNEICEFLNIYNCDCIYLVAHNNSNFDRFFFKYIFKNDMVIGPILSSKVKYIDSIHLAKYLFPNVKSFNLKRLCNLFGIVPGEHRARSDTEALKNLFDRMLHILSQKINVDYNILLQNPKIIYDILY